jgi:hypothetical protein
MAIRLPFALLQAFLAPFRLFPVMLWLTWLADVPALQRSIAKGVAVGPAAKHVSPALEHFCF